MMLLALGWRNLRRNSRRSAAVICSIAIAFTAVALFAGYMKMVYRGLAEQAVYGELIGHFTVSKRGLATEGRLHPEKFLLTAEQIAQVSQALRAARPGLFVARRLALSGILSNGRAGTIFIAEGVDPADMQVLRGPRVMSSGALRADQPAGVALADGLAATLGLKDGDAASVLVSTIHGQANAADVNVVDTFSTGNAGTGDKFMFMPLALAQSLADAEGHADRLTLMLRDGEPDERAQAALARALRGTGLDLEIHSWREMSAFYRQVKTMFDMIFGFLLAIVLTIVVMSVANAMSMGVMERTREIGTLRAIGMQRRGVALMFAVEALLLVLIGCLSGLALFVAVRHGVDLMDIRYLPPNSTDPVPLLIGFDATRTLLAALALAVLGLGAAWLPAARAARRPITASLGHV